MGDRLSKTKILIFDTDREWAEAAKSVLTDQGFAVETQCIDFQTCINAVELKKKMYAIAIVNVHALKNPSKLLEQFTTASPVTAVVAVMDHEDPQASKLLWPPNTLVKYLFGSKKSHLVGDLPALIKGHLQISRILPSNLSITWPDDIRNFLKDYSLSRTEPRRMHNVLSQEVLYDELTYIVRQLFSNKHSEAPVTQAVRVGNVGEAGGHSATGIIQILQDYGKTIQLFHPLASVRGNTHRPSVIFLLTRCQPELEFLFLRP